MFERQLISDYAQELKTTCEDPQRFLERFAKELRKQYADIMVQTTKEIDSAEGKFILFAAAASLRSGHPLIHTID